jgi:hypothetical protein
MLDHMKQYGLSVQTEELPATSPSEAVASICLKVAATWAAM